jgi:hypothetical protein
MFLLKILYINENIYICKVIYCEKNIKWVEKIMKINKTISILSILFLLSGSLAGAINTTNETDEHPSIIKESDTEKVLTSKCWYSLTTTGDTVAAAVLGLHLYDYEWDHYREAWRYKIRLTGMFNGNKFLSFVSLGKSMSIESYHRYGIKGGGVMAKSGVNLDGADGPQYDKDDIEKIIAKSLSALNRVASVIVKAKEIIELLNQCPDTPDELDTCYVEENQNFAVCYYEYDFLVAPNTEFRIDFDFEAEFQNLNFQYETIKLSKNEQEYGGKYNGEGMLTFNGIAPESAEYDIKRPEVYMLKPEPGIYIGNEYRGSFPVPLILGNIDIAGESNDLESGTSNMKFYVNNTKRYTDYSRPYYWNWNDRDFGVREIKIESFDRAGNHNYTTLKTIYLNPYGEPLPVFDDYECGDCSLDVKKENFVGGESWRITVLSGIGTSVVSTICDLIDDAIEAAYDVFKPTEFVFSYVFEYGKEKTQETHKSSIPSCTVFTENNPCKVKVKITIDIKIDCNHNGAYEEDECYMIHTATLQDGENKCSGLVKNGLAARFVLMSQVLQFPVLSRFLNLL